MAIEFYKLIIGSISILAALYADKYEKLDRERMLKENEAHFFLPQSQEYDFIVVGAGSAGGVVANRLSKDFTVLLLEAGGDPLPQSYVPANECHLIYKSFMMHFWESVEQTQSSLGSNGIAKIMTGKFLGGSSVVNGMLYNRGHPKDFDNWANLTGDDGWKYENVLKYFQMTEDFSLDENKNGHLGVGGPLPIRRSDPGFKPLYDAMIAAGKESGYSEFQNPNAPQTEGFGPITQNNLLGRRFSIYDAFIKPILDRSTLTISRYSTVSHIDIDEKNKAVGVYYTRHGVLHYAKARKEIIVSGGTMNSPVILLRSGIGPKDQLNSAGVPVKLDLPGVGQNLQDHPNTLICGKFANDAKYPYNDLTQKDVDDFLHHGKGPLTLPAGMPVQAFVVSSLAKLEGQSDWPDLQLTVYNDAPLYWEKSGKTICIVVNLGRVKSIGSISLDLKDVNNPGIWDPQWLAEERDAKVLAEGMKISANIFESKGFKELGIIPIQDPDVREGCKTFEYGSDAYWECHVRRITRTTWHVTSTCKMGAKSDPTSVVDSRLRVHGIGGLRVVDNSIQPTVTNANTHAPAIMIGQKGAAMILEDHQYDGLVSQAKSARNNECERI